MIGGRKHQVRIIDSHTGGEPTRVVIDGGPVLGSGPIAQQLERFRTEFDALRSAIVNEPRGSDVIVGALLVEPTDPSCAAGVIFFNNVGYLGMCGHGTIGLVVTLAHMGRIGPGTHKIETCVGTVTATLHKDGTVSVDNVPSYRKVKQAPCSIPGVGDFTGDVAWAGNWFYLCENHGLQVTFDNIERLTDLAWKIRQAINAQGYPEIDHIELFGPPKAPGAKSKSFVLCPGKAYDRSPCGTGTSAKLACVAADGKLKEGEIWVQESIIGSTFTGKFRNIDDKQIIPTITGSAYVTAEATLILDDKDPFRWGIGGGPGCRSRAVNATFDIVVVGAGIVGAACAAECAVAGQKVLILDQSCIGGGTTAAGMGHVVVMDDSEAQLALTRYSRDLWRELAAQMDGAGKSKMPADVEWDPCGTLWVAADDEEMAEVRRKKQICDEHGIAAEIWDAQTLAKGEPKLRPGLTGALRLPDDGVIYPPTAAKFLIAQAQQHGAQLRLNTKVKSLDPNGGVELADGTLISCGIVVNAAGAVSPALTPGISVKKRKGHLVITDRYPGYVHHQIVELGYLKSAHSVSSDSVAFNIQPRKTGQMLLGYSRQYNAEGYEVDAGILGKMLRRAEEYLPDVGTLKAIRVWTGHRPATPDKLPLIGPSLVSDKIYLATGHEGLGITTSTGTGRLLADLILNRPTGIPSEPYLPARYAKADAHAEVAHA